MAAAKQSFLANEHEKRMMMRTEEKKLYLFTNYKSHELLFKYYSSKYLNFMDRDIFIKKKLKNI